MIRLGYVAVNTLLPTSSRTFRLANYTDEKMLCVARENLSALQKILEWNRDNGVALFRITSHLIPFGSSPINSGIWRKVLADTFAAIGHFIRANGMRVSMHPGHYTVLNTPSERVFESTLRELTRSGRLSVNSLSPTAVDRLILDVRGTEFCYLGHYDTNAPHSIFLAWPICAPRITTMHQDAEV
jgi:UV DNA damage repair endonuclease